jgi:site-specific recombinase XerD
LRSSLSGDRLARERGDGVEKGRGAERVVVGQSPDAVKRLGLWDGFKPLKEAKLVEVTPHTLRHTFASKLAMVGVDPRTIQELGGWRSLEMVERYTHLSPTHKAEAVERIAGNFPTVITTPAPAPPRQRAASAVS